MYPRLKRVRRGDQVHEYVQLVEGRREAGKVRQRVVATLGRLDELKASGQLDRWAGAFTRLDPPAAGVHREVGPLLVVAHYLRRLGLVGLVDAAAPMRGRAQATHGEVIAALVANRLSGPAPLYDVAGWAGAYAVAELLGVPAGLLNDDRLGRALDALAPVVEDVRARTLLATLERFEVEASRLHLDLTAVRFAGAYLDSALVAKGWAADRTVGRQVRALFATTAQGVTLYARPQKGSQAELDGIAPELDHVAQREQHLPSQLRTRYRGQLVDYPAVDPKTKSRHAFRVAYTWSSEEARSVADARERRRRPAGRPVRAGHQPARPARPTAHRPRRARHLQGPVDRRAAQPGRQTPHPTAGPPDLPAHRPTHPGPLRRDRHRAAHLRTHRSRPVPGATRRRPPPTRTAARRPNRQTHRTQHPRRLRTPRPHPHRQRAGARPPHPPPAADPRPPRHPPALAGAARAVALPPPPSERRGRPFTVRKTGLADGRALGEFV